MKINSLKTSINQSQQSKQQNFKGSLANSAANFISKHPVAIAGLAGSSVVAQKIVMSGAEATIGPVMDIAIGKGITKATGEKDGRTNTSSKTQAIRTCAQSTGGTITGVAIRSLCILGTTMAFIKAGEKAGSKIGEVVNPDKINSKTNPYAFQKNASAWGKTVGGALAICVMMFTNFLLDVPLVNFINKKITDVVNKKPKNEQQKAQGGAK